MNVNRAGQRQILLARKCVVGEKRRELARRDPLQTMPTRHSVFDRCRVCGKTVVRIFARNANCFGHFAGNCYNSYREHRASFGAIDSSLRGSTRRGYPLLAFELQQYWKSNCETSTANHRKHGESLRRQRKTRGDGPVSCENKKTPAAQTPRARRGEL